VARASCACFTGGDARATSQNKSGFELIEAAYFFHHESACQLEGSDHGGRDSAAELALAGTNDVQVPDSSYNRLDFGANPIRREKLCSPHPESVNEIILNGSGPTFDLLSALCENLGGLCG